jgi:Lrp/AsnC family transcriptional regulator, regulator of ectoine-degradation genes
MTSPKLDAIDLKILTVLQQEGRITKLALAERVNLSPTPCWERLKRLEDAGIITGYHARVELRQLAPTTTVMVEITLQRHRQSDFVTFETQIRSIPEIVECWAVGGGVDYILKVITPDVDTYQRLIDRMLDSELGIDRYFTYIVTKPVKESQVLPIEALMKVRKGGDLR